MSNFIEEDVVQYYIDGENGADTNNGTSTSTAWKTIQKMVEMINAASASGYDGDMFVIMKTSDDATHYGLTGEHVVEWNNQDMVITGANSDGVVDGTVVEINGDGLDGSTPMVRYNSGLSDGGVWANLYFNAADTAEHCVEASAANAHSVMFVNCRFSSATDDGVNLNANSNYWNFVNCRFDNNGQCGMQQTSGSQFNVVYKCMFDNNGDNGLDCGALARVIECIFHNNEDRGCHPNHGGSVLCNNIFDSNREDGAYVTGSGTSIWVNNIFSNNVQDGIQMGSNTEATHFNSLFYNNNQDFNDLTGSNSNAKYFNYVPGASGINPNFVNGTGPTFDFTTAATGASAGFLHGSGMPTHFRIHGTTSDDPGLYKFIKTETATVF